MKIGVGALYVFTLICSMLSPFTVKKNKKNPRRRFFGFFLFLIFVNIFKTSDDKNAPFFLARKGLLSRLFEYAID